MGEGITAAAAGASNTAALRRYMAINAASAAMDYTIDWDALNTIRYIDGSCPSILAVGLDRGP